MRPSTNLRELFARKIWQKDLSQMGLLQRIAVRLLRSAVIAAREFVRDNCPLKASALTFYTLLSIVPIVALLFGIARGFGLEHRLEQTFQADIAYNRKALQYILDLSVQLIESTSGTFVASAGTAVLIWALMRLVGQIEQSFNDIFEIRTGRSIFRKFTDYLSMTLVAPVLIALTGSVSVYLSTGISAVATQYGFPDTLDPPVRLLMGLIPIFTSVVLFTLTYIILPNTRVKFSAALMGALFAAPATALVGWLYLTFQIGVSKYNAIYGGLAALPLFLVFINTNWLIVLLGAELGHGFQNHGDYELVIDTSNVSNGLRMLLSLYLVKRFVDAFERGEPSPSPRRLSEELKVPNKLIRWTIDELVQAEVISPVVSPAGSPCYHPAISPDRLDTYFVTSRLERHGIDRVPVKKDALFERVAAALSEFDNAAKSSSGNVLLRDL